MAKANGHEDPFARATRVVVRAQPVKTAIHAYVPWVAHSAGVEFQAVSTREATKDCTLLFALVHRVVALGISFPGVDLGQRVLRIVIRLEPLQITKRLRGVRFYPGVADRHIEPAVGAPVQPVQAVAQIIEPRIDNLVFVGNVIAIGVTQDR